RDESDMAPGDGVCAVAPSGLCTLRAAIQEANAAVGSDAVQFNLPPEGGYVISPASVLPEIVGSLVIDGTTQAGYSGQPLVELDGTNAGSGERPVRQHLPWQHQHDQRPGDPRLRSFRSSWRRRGEDGHPRQR